MAKVNLESMKCSVILPVYNAELFLEKCIDSVLSQTYRNLELLICDDGSSDNSIAVINQFRQKDNRVIFFTNETNKGVAQTRNRLLNEVSGDLIAFIDADDWWESEKLSIQVKQITEGFDLVCSDYSRNGKVIKGPELITLNAVLNNNCIPLSSVMLRAAVLESIRFSNIRHEDYDLWLRLFNRYPKLKAIRVPKPLMNYRVHENSLTRNKVKSIIWTFKVYRRSGLGYFSSLLRTAINIRYSLAKYK